MMALMISLSRVGCTMAYNTGYISISRLFPTQYVSTVMGLVNVVGHVFACFAPLVAEIEAPYPFIIFLFLLVVAFVMTRQV